MAYNSEVMVGMVGGEFGSVIGCGGIMRLRVETMHLELFRIRDFSCWFYPFIIILSW